MTCPTCHATCSGLACPYCLRNRAREDNIRKHIGGIGAAGYRVAQRSFRSIYHLELGDVREAFCGEPLPPRHFCRAQRTGEDLRHSPNTRADISPSCLEIFDRVLTELERRASA